MAPGEPLRNQESVDTPSAAGPRHPLPQASNGDEAAPGVWTMPSRGIEWCDCGQHHELDRDIVLGFARGRVKDPDG